MTAPAAEPYSPPVSMLSTSGPVDCFAAGGFLMVRDGSVLPADICPISGRPIPPDSPLPAPRLIHWSPPWVFGMALFFVLPMIVLILALQKRAKISYVLSEGVRKRTRQKKRNAFLALAAGSGLFGAALLAGDRSGLFMLGVTGLMLVMLSIILFILVNPMRVGGYRKGWFRIKGCSPRFLKSLPPFPAGEA